jgi:uncharacterized protein YbjT (DUF2867 family)
MILVTAATGQIGGQTARDLLAAGAPVRALVRDLARATGLEGAELIVGSFDDDVALARAIDGIDGMLLAGRDSPDAVAQHQRVLAHARRAGVEHIVKLSAIGASPDSRVALMREHHEVDEEIRQGPASWTFLKPHLFMQNLLRAAEAIQRDGELAAAMGDERFPLVDTRDAGAAAATVLADPTRHAGEVYNLTGPAALSYDQVAAAMAAVAGRPVTYKPVQPDAQQARLIDAGLPDWRAYDLAHIASAYAPADNIVSPDLEALLGRPPRSLAEFLDDHREAFCGNAR